MSVLVKGMKMPKSCDECFFYNGGGCFVTMNIVLLKRDEDKPEWCPLVEVSESECVVGCDGICEECPMGKEKDK